MSKCKCYAGVCMCEERDKPTCLSCGRKVQSTQEFYMVTPGHIVVPASYYLCDDHKQHRYSFEDIYNPDATRKTDTQLIRELQQKLNQLHTEHGDAVY